MADIHDRRAQIDEEKHTMTVEAGLTLEKLSDIARSHGLEVSVLGSISTQTIAGAVSTATHGFGVDYGCISTYINRLKLLLADGSLVECSATQDPDLFNATLCGLGATGVIVEATVQLEPIYNLTEVKEEVDFDHFLTSLPQLWSSAQHVRAYWIPQLGRVEINRVNRTIQNTSQNWSLFTPPGLFDTFRTSLANHIKDVGLLISSYTSSYRFDTWVAWLVHRIMPFHNRIGPPRSIFNFDCGSPQFTFEAAIPLHNAPQCLSNLKTFFEECKAERPHFPIELRPTKADNIPLSPCNRGNGEPSLWVGIVSYKPFGRLVIPHEELFEGYAKILYKSGAKPHWAKAHQLSYEDIQKVFGADNVHQWKQVRSRVDKDMLFTNEYVRRHLGLGENQ